MSEPSPIAQLVALQQIDSDLERAGHEITAMRAGLVDERAVQAAQARANATAKAERAAHQELRAAEAELTDTETRIKRNEQRQASGAITSPKDLAAVDHELVFLHQKRGELDERVLTAMDALEAATAAAQAAQAQLTETEQQRVAEKAQQHKQLADAEVRQADLQPKRAAAAQEIDPALLTRYEGIRKVRGRAVAQAFGNVCQGCRVTLQPPIVAKLRAGRNEIVTCGNCGRILIAG